MTFDQVTAKMHGNIEFLMRQSIGKNGSFDRLTGLTVQFDESGKVNLK